MKLTAKLFLIVSLFCSVALANPDGDMGNGGITGPPPPPPCTENCRAASGTVNPTGSEQKDSEGSIFSLIRDYLYDLLG